MRHIVRVRSRHVMCKGLPVTSSNLGKQFVKLAFALLLKEAGQELVRIDEDRG